LPIHLPVSQLRKFLLKHRYTFGNEAVISGFISDLFADHFAGLKGLRPYLAGRHYQSDWIAAFLAEKRGAKVSC
jgi:hypothetical protein